MAKKAPRTFLCIGGPKSGQALDLGDASQLGYRRYNRAWVGNNTFPKALLLHTTFLTDTLEIARGREKREADLAK